MTKSNGIRDLLAFLVLILQKTRGLNKEFPLSKQEQTFIVGAFCPSADFSGGQRGRTGRAGSCCCFIKVLLNGGIWKDNSKSRKFTDEVEFISYLLARIVFTNAYRHLS